MRSSPQGDDARRRATGKVAYQDGFTPMLNDNHVAGTPRHLGLRLDTSQQTPDETVVEILARQAESLVG